MISPILANIYLHYVVDLWSDAWRRKKASGDVIVIRYPVTASTPEPEGGARCVSSARRDLCGGGERGNPPPYRDHYERCVTQGPVRHCPRSGGAFLSPRAAVS